MSESRSSTGSSKKTGSLGGSAASGSASSSRHSSSRRSSHHHHRDKKTSSRRRSSRKNTHSSSSSASSSRRSTKIRLREWSRNASASIELSSALAQLQSLVEEELEELPPLKASATKQRPTLRGSSSGKGSIRDLLADDSTEAATADGSSSHNGSPLLRSSSEPPELAAKRAHIMAYADLCDHLTSVERILVAFKLEIQAKTEKHRKSSSSQFSRWRSRAKLLRSCTPTLLQAWSQSPHMNTTHPVQLLANLLLSLLNDDVELSSRYLCAYVTVVELIQNQMAASSVSKLSDMLQTTWTSCSAAKEALFTLKEEGQDGEDVTVNPKEFAQLAVTVLLDCGTGWSCCSAEDWELLASPWNKEEDASENNHAVAATTAVPSTSTRMMNQYSPRSLRQLGPPSSIREEETEGDGHDPTHQGQYWEDPIPDHTDVYSTILADIPPGAIMALDQVRGDNIPVPRNAVLQQLLDHVFAAPANSSHRIAVTSIPIPTEEGDSDHENDEDDLDDYDPRYRRVRKDSMESHDPILLRPNYRLTPQSGRGMAGVGKTTAVALACSRLDVRAHYNGGILWLTLGNHYYNGGMRHDFYMDCLTSMCHQLGYDDDDLMESDDEDDEEHQYEDEWLVPKFKGLIRIPLEEESVRRKSEELLMREAKDKMAKLLRLRLKGDDDNSKKKRILIVLDDVHDEGDLEWFRFEVSAQILVTTRSRTLPADEYVQVGLFEESEGLALLMTESDHPRDHVICQSTEAREIVQQCNCHPLTIRTVARWFRLKEASVGAVKAMEEIHSDVQAVARMSLSGTHLERGSIFAAEGRLMSGILDRMLSPIMAGKPTPIMHFCLAALMKLCFPPMDADGTSIPVPKPIPLEAAHSLWEALLQLEEKALFDGKTLDDSQRRRQVLLITRAFSSMGLIHIYSKESEEEVADWKSAMTPGSKELFEQSYMIIHHDMVHLYGDGLIGRKDGSGLPQELATNYELAWNRAFVTAYLTNKQKRDIEGTVDSSRVYALEFLVSHMLRANMLTRAAALLQDKRFIRKRFDAQGWERGTMRHIRDCKQLRRKMMDSKEASLDPESVALGVYQVVSNVLKDLMQGVKEELVVEACRCMHEMGTAMVEMQSWDRAIEEYKASLIYLLPRELPFAFVEAYSVGVVLLLSGETHKGIETLHACLTNSAQEDATFGRGNIYCRALHRIGDARMLICEYSSAFETYNKVLDVMYGDSASSGVYFQLLIGAVLHSKGRGLFKLGKLEEAVDVFKEAIRWKKMELGDNHFDLAMDYYWMGHALTELNQEEDANDTFTESLRLLSLGSSIQSKHEVTIRNHQVKGALFKLHEKNNEALAEYANALKLLKTHTSYDSERIADAIHKVACMYVLTGEDKLAVEFFLRGVEMRSARDRNIDIATALYLAGCAHIRLKDDASGLLCLEEALAIQNQVTPESDAVADTLTQIGAVHRNQKKYKEAMTSYAEAMDVCARQHGPDSSRVVLLLLEMGEVSFEAKDYEHAVQRFDHGLNTQRRILSYGDPTIAETLIRKGDVLLKQKKFEAAAKSYHEALKINKANFSPKQECVYQSVRKVGVAEHKLGNNNEALNYLFDALDPIKASGDKMALAEISSNIGDVRRATKDYLIASQFYTDCIGILLEEKGDAHELVGDAYIKLAATRALLEEFMESKMFYAKGLRIWKDTVGAINERVAGVHRSLGIIEYLMTDTYQAKRNLEEFERIRGILKDEMDMDSIQVMFLLGKVHSKMGDDEEAHMLWSKAYRDFLSNGYGVVHGEFGQELTRVLEEVETAADRPSFFRAVSERLVQEEVAAADMEADDEDPDYAFLLRHANFMD